MTGKKIFFFLIMMLKTSLKMFFSNKIFFKKFMRSRKDFENDYLISFYRKNDEFVQTCRITNKRA